MMNKHRNSALSVLVVMALLLAVLTGCDTEDQKSSVSAETSIAESTSSPADAANPTAESSVGELDDTQRNSIAILNYLTVLTQEINASKYSRLFLEEAYSSLINNTYPNAVDTITLAQLGGILDTLENYRMVDVKRDRLQYIYEQNRAQALREAVPNPLALMSAIQSDSKKKLAAAILYMAVDSYTSYTTYTAQTDLQYLKDGWALDDEEAAVLHNSRKDAFNYTVKIVTDHNLPGNLSLSENAVDEFVTWKNNDNAIQRIQFLESNRETYQALGEYWLVLAESYYLNENYDKCIEAVTTYESLQTRIFRKDYGLSKVLPMAIIAAGNTMDDTQYVEIAARYAEEILENTDNDEWALRYFAAQTYVELYAKTGDSLYLDKAYAIALDNVNALVVTQREINTAFLSKVAVKTMPKGSTKAEKAQIEKYNMQLKEERKTALPPIYEPLLLNCELLFSLAQELNIGDGEKAKIDGILHENGECIFLIPSIDTMYRFGSVAEATADEEIKVSFRGSELSLPAKYISADAYIKVTVTEPKADAPIVYEDWEVVSVSRKSNDNLDSFNATFKSPTAEKHKYSTKATIEIEIVPKKDCAAETLCFAFAAYNTKNETWEVIKIWDDGVAFKRAE